MNYLRLAFGLAVAGILVVLWGQYRQIGLQKQLIAAQAQATNDLRAGLKAIQDNGEKNRTQMAELLHAQQRVQTNLTARNSEIRRLQNDVQEVRDWARQSLPADIQRVLNQPAATGASGYGESVPAGDPVHAVASGPENKR